VRRRKSAFAQGYGATRKAEERINAADGAMFATANLSIGGFDVRGFRLRTGYGATSDV
jgi:hypothetical protein